MFGYYNQQFENWVEEEAERCCVTFINEGELQSCGELLNSSIIKPACPVPAVELQALHACLLWQR